MKNISATSIKLYEQCPRLWQWKYIYKLLQPYNEAFDIGTLYHLVLQKYYEAPIRNDETRNSIITWLNREIIKDKTDEEFAKFGLIRTMFEKYIEYPLLDDVKTVEIEYEFTVKTDVVPVPLYGFMDRLVEGGVIDYKTTSADYKEKDVIENVQTDLYAYVYWMVFGTIPTVYYHVMNKKKANKPNYEPQIFELKRTKEDMDAFEERLLRFYNNVMANNFKAKYQKGYWLYKQYI